MTIFHFRFEIGESVINTESWEFAYSCVLFLQEVYGRVKVDRLYI